MKATVKGIDPGVFSWVSMMLAAGLGARRYPRDAGLLEPYRTNGN
jgi:hypothetical protein